MSLRPQAPPTVPEETRRVARAAFPRGTLCLRVADALGPVHRDGRFAALFPRRGQPAAAPGRLALAAVLQFVENLSDREAADAVRGRIDWKCALGLALTDPGLDHTVLSEFRSRLIAGGAELLLLDTLLQRLQEQGLVKARGRSRTDSTHVLAAVRVLNRLERGGEALRAALNELAAVAPEWLSSVAPAAWYERYGRRVENHRLPKTEAARSALAAAIGGDGQLLLSAIDAARPELVRLPKVAILRRVWAAQYAEEERGRLRWRATDALPPCAEQVCSPYDPDARYSTKREADWTGHMAHTVRTQSTIRLQKTLAPWRRAAQWDDVADLQAVLVDDDALDDELQDRLLLGKRCLVQPAAHAFAERGQVAQDLLGLGALAE